MTDTKTAAAAAAATVPAVPPAPKPPLVGGGRVAAIVPQDFESAYRLANVVVSSGMAPKSLDTVEKATVAIMHGLEVGFTPMAALQSIAVVNGMPTIYGDGMLALVRASGLLEDIIEEGEDDKDGPTFAVCKVKRAGQASWTVRMFTRPQAMKAGLWKKQGPWMQYPQRMMQMRARAWALRDAFADVLRGLGSAEEVSDIVDVTATGSATTAPPEPRRSDYVHTGSDVAEQPNEQKREDPPHNATTGEVKDEKPAADRWLSKATGQEAITKDIVRLIGEAKTLDDLEAIDKANGDRVAKFTQANRVTITNAMDDKKEDLGGGS